MRVTAHAGTSEGSPLTATLTDFVRQLDRFLMEPDQAFTERMAAACRHCGWSPTWSMPMN